MVKKMADMEIGGKVSKNQIVQWISEKYGDVNHNTIRTPPKIMFNFVFNKI